MTELREKIIAEIGEISEYLTEVFKDNYYRQGSGGKAERMIKLVNSVFEAIADERHEVNECDSGKEWYAVTAATFGATMPVGDDIRTVGKGLTSISVNGENVEITRTLAVWKNLPARKEVVTKWVQTDENTRVRETVLDAFGKPKMKNMKAEMVSELVPMVFTLPLTFFEDLLTEIEQESLILVPDQSYIPESLGLTLKKALSGLGGALVFADGWGMHPMYRVNYSQPSTPFRLFLKPEKGSDRLEVIFEPYPENEVKANRALITAREQWRRGDVSRTKAVFALCERVKEKYIELKGTQNKGDKQ